MSLSNHPFSFVATTTTTPASGTGSGAPTADLHDLVLFSLGVLLIFGVVVMITGGTRASVSRFRTIGRIYALLALAGFGTALAFATLADSARTAAFTLLGTVAGYLAGAPGSTDAPSPGGGQDDQGSTDDRQTPAGVL